MKNQKSFLLMAALSAFTYQAVKPQEARAVLIAGWTFEGKTLLGTGNSFTGANMSTGYIAETGSGTMYGVHTVTNSIWTHPAGNGTAVAMSAIGWTANNSFWEFSVSTLGLKDILINFDQVSSSTGPKTWTIQTKVGSGPYTSFASYNLGYNSSGGTTSWSATIVRTESQHSFNLSSLSALNNQSSVSVRLLVSGTAQYGTGTTSFPTSGSSRIDNITINATPVPEPATAAIMAAGAAVAASRKRKRS